MTGVSILGQGFLYCLHFYSRKRQNVGYLPKALSQSHLQNLNPIKRMGSRMTYIHSLSFETGVTVFIRVVYGDTMVHSDIQRALSAFCYLSTQETP